MASKALTIALFLSVFSGFARAEEPGKLVIREGKDDISGKAWHAVAIVADDNKSLLQLKVYEGSAPSLGIIPDDTIFPDKTDAIAKTMEVSVTLRSTAMDKPVTRMWQMPFMKYESAAARYLTEEVEQIFGGDSVTVQFDKVGRRYRFPTAGAGLEKLKEAVAQVLSHAPTPEQDEARLAELLRANGIANNGAAVNREKAGEIDESREVSEARKEGEECGRNMRTRTAGAHAREHEIRGRAKTTAERKGFKKPTDPRRKAFVEGYMSQFPEFGAGK